MRTIRPTRFFRCIVLPLALVAVLPACFRWEPLNDPFDRSISDGRPEQIRVSLPEVDRIDIRGEDSGSKIVLGSFVTAATIAFSGAFFSAGFSFGGPN